MVMMMMFVSMMMNMKTTINHYFPSKLCIIHMQTNQIPLPSLLFQVLPRYMRSSSFTSAAAAAAADADDDAPITGCKNTKLTHRASHVTRHTSHVMQASAARC
jgi:hypothetical protein